MSKNPTSPPIAWRLFFKIKAQRIDECPFRQTLLYLLILLLINGALVDSATKSQDCEEDRIENNEAEDEGFPVATIDKRFGSHVYKLHNMNCGTLSHRSRILGRGEGREASNNEE